MSRHSLGDRLRVLWRDVRHRANSTNTTYTFLFFFIFTGVFAPFLASSQPLFIYDKAGYEQKSGIQLKRSPLLYSLVYSDAQVEKIEYRRLVEKAKSVLSSRWYRIRLTKLNSKITSGPRVSSASGLCITSVPMRTAAMSPHGSFAARATPFWSHWLPSGLP